MRVYVTPHIDEMTASIRVLLTHVTSIFKILHSNLTILKYELVTVDNDALCLSLRLSIGSNTWFCTSRKKISTCYIAQSETFQTLFSGVQII